MEEKDLEQLEIFDSYQQESLVKAKGLADKLFDKQFQDKLKELLDQGYPYPLSTTERMVLLHHLKESAEWSFLFADVDRMVKKYEKELQENQDE